MKRIALAFALTAGLAATANAQVWERHINPGYLGIRFDNSMTVTNGTTTSTITVREVMKDSPAEKAGMKAGDVVIRIDGREPNGDNGFNLGKPISAGDTVKLRVRRGTAEKDVTIIAGKRPAGENFMIRVTPDSVRRLMRIFMDSAMVHLDSMNLPNITIMRSDSGFDFKVLTLPRDSMFFKRDSTAMRLFRERAGDRFPMLPPDEWKVEAGPGMIFRSMELGNRSIGGAELAEVDPAMVDVLKTDKGLLVLRVAPETPADRAGLQPGDVIVRAKARDVRKVEDLRAIVRANPDGVKIDVLRKGATRSIELKTRGR